jgi:hypothetical protein
MHKFISNRLRELSRHPACHRKTPEVLEMVAAVSVLLVGVIGILFVRRRGARKRSDVAATAR